jgi:hypothetical protein
MEILNQQMVQDTASLTHWTYHERKPKNWRPGRTLIVRSPRMHCAVLLIQHKTLVDQSQNRK